MLHTSTLAWAAVAAAVLGVEASRPPEPLPRRLCPTAREQPRLPVNVYSYGGGNIGGAITYRLYNACSLARDAIVVTFNYRLGALGFLALDAAGIRGNAAIPDHLVALRWVRDNIAAFGDAPDRSGGGRDVTSYEMAQKAGAAYAEYLHCRRTM
ncbi:Carboxylesterase, type B [Cordyceps fumosorosea ARSEF 2679]|uniref:Carboxylesterase, type B n=1 Tax=Cordyceps fumosorosea (strain ARSEF 2679) TaxID=1081104 RepID=A0A167LB97_CORFA|nr:Carboxylesterase, type B [Cordyceps fumosorosea ARSEF 2679]OAA52876.1 Carboxylesterase, type B [Cordyceps fumosorosea ARSEF 2679]